MLVFTLNMRPSRAISPWTLAAAAILFARVSYGRADFSSVPTTVKTYETSAVLLPCYLDTTNNDGAESLRVKWYKDDVLWADSGQQDFLPPMRFKLWGNGSLQVVDIQSSDTGKYTCEVVRSEPWTSVRQVHAIEVLHPPTVFPQPEGRFLEVKLGEEVEMGCITGGVPTPIVTWTHNGEPLELISNRNVLRFNASDRRLAGTYECVAMNGVGEAARDRIELRVLYPPEASATRPWLHAAPDSRVQMECGVSAVPRAVVTWHKGERPLKTDRRVVQLLDGHTHVLLIKRVVKSDFGLYQCRATNDVGEATVDYQLSGVPNPAVFKSAGKENEKDSYTFIWEVESYTPIIEYNLRFRPYKGTDSSQKLDWTNLTIPTEHKINSHVYSKKYTIRGLKERTTYEVQILSRNRYGWSRPSSILRFAIDEGEVVTERITTAPIIEPHDSIDTITPLEITSGNDNCHLPKSSLFIVFLLSIYMYI